MRTVINQAHAELELIKTQKDFSEFLSKYEDVFSFSDSTLTPKIQIEALKSIVNRNGLYEINGHLVKVTENKILSASKDKYESLVSVKNSDPSELSRLGIQVHDMDIQDINLLSDGRTNEACATTMENSYYYNPSGCKDDRKAYFRARSYRQATPGSGGTYYDYRVEILVWGTRRSGTFCNWSGYNTQLEYRNIAFSIWAYQRLSLTTSASTSEPRFFPIPLNDESLNDAGSLVTDFSVGDWLFNEPQPNNPFTSFYGEAKSQGIGNNWIVITCP
ncbi:MAG: hypothetical protein ACOYXA_18340 [Bacteroidota bacterium]